MVEKNKKSQIAKEKKHIAETNLKAKQLEEENARKRAILQADIRLAEAKKEKANIKRERSEANLKKFGNILDSFESFMKRKKECQLG